MVSICACYAIAALAAFLVGWWIIYNILEPEHSRIGWCTVLILVGVLVLISLSSPSHLSPMDRARQELLFRRRKDEESPPSYDKLPY